MGIKKQIIIQWQKKVFEDSFNILEVNKEGRFFENISRIHAISLNGQIELSADLLNEAFGAFPLVLSLTIYEESQNFSQEEKERKLEDAQFVLNGKVIHIGDTENEINVIVSAGGLITKMTGASKGLEGMKNCDGVILKFKTKTEN